MKKTLLALTFLAALPCQAEEAFFSFGIGAANSAKEHTGEVKMGNFGLREEIYQGIYLQYKVGYFGDGSGDPTRNSSLYGSVGPGMLIDLRPVEIRAGYGLAAISTPDSYLGGRFPQFQGELYLGLRDHRGNGIGVQYEHISSAGIVTPNQGRDFIVLQLSQQW